MTGSEYQKAAMRTCDVPNIDVRQVLGLSENNYCKFKHGMYGLVSEVGEASGILQKISQGHEWDENHFLKELGDCLWFIAELCDAFGVTMDMIMQMNIDKLKARYPDGFDSEHSLHREEGDI